MGADNSSSHDQGKNIPIAGMFDVHHGGWAFWIAVILISAIPRILRILDPEVWIEDAKYLYHAYALSIGQQPYTEGIYAHPPTFEGLLAILFGLFGVSYRIAEFFSACVVTLCSLLVYDLCRRATGRWAALTACAVFSVSPLLFRYHVYEREVFTMLLATAAFWVQLSCAKSARTALAAGSLAGLAVTVKLSALFYVPPLLLVYLMWREWRLLALCLTGFMIVGGVVWGAIFASFGWPAFFQSILFHFVKGGTPGIQQIFSVYMIPNLNVLLVSGFGGLLLGSLVDRRDVIAAAGLLWVEIVLFFTVISESVVPHNTIDLLMPLAIGTAYAFQGLAKIFEKKSGAWTRAVIVVGFGIVFLLLGALKGEHLSSGWGYIPRDEMKKAAIFLEQNVSPGVPISAPQYLATEARRTKIVDDRELTGPYLWMIRTLTEEGFDGLKKHREFGSWGQLVAATIPLWRHRVDLAIRNNRAGAVVWDSIFPEWRPYYLIDIEREIVSGFLSSAGYRIRYRSGPYVIWLPSPRR